MNKLTWVIYSAQDPYWRASGVCVHEPGGMYFPDEMIRSFINLTQGGNTPVPDDLCLSVYRGERWSKLDSIGGAIAKLEDELRVTNNRLLNTRRRVDKLLDFGLAKRKFLRHNVSQLQKKLNKAMAREKYLLDKLHHRGIKP